MVRKNFLPTSPHLTLPCSAIYYPQILELKERGIMHHFMFLLFGLSDFHNCQFIMDHLLQARNPCPHTATIRQYDTNDFF